MDKQYEKYSIERRNGWYWSCFIFFADHDLLIHNFLSPYVIKYLFTYYISVVLEFHSVARALSGVGVWPLRQYIANRSSTANIHLDGLHVTVNASSCTPRDTKQMRRRELWLSIAGVADLFPEVWQATTFEWHILGRLSLSSGSRCPRKVSKTCETNASQGPAVVKKLQSGFMAAFDPSFTLSRRGGC